MSTKALTQYVKLCKKANIVATVEGLIIYYFVNYKNKNI